MATFDRAREWGNLAINMTQSFQRIGWDGTAAEHIRQCARFGPMDIPQGTVITSATVGWTTHATLAGSGARIVTMRGDATIFGNSSSSVYASRAAAEGASLTTASASPVIATTAATAGDVDATAVVQEVLNVGSWPSTAGYMVMQLRPSADSGTGWRRVAHSSYSLEILTPDGVYVGWGIPIGIS